MRRDVANAQWLAEQVDAAPDWERLAPAPLQTVCLRHVPRGGADGAASGEAGLAAHNLAIADRINDAGRFYLTPAVLKGTQMLRVSVGAQATERKHVEGLWQALREAAG